MNEFDEKVMTVQDGMNGLYYLHMALCFLYNVNLYDYDSIHLGEMCSSD